jgi:hypothetical protein
MHEAMLGIQGIHLRIARVQKLKKSGIGELFGVAILHRGILQN